MMISREMKTECCVKRLYVIFTRSVEVYEEKGDSIFWGILGGKSEVKA